MANTCCTDIRITGPEDRLDALQKELGAALAITCPEPGPWLGKLFMHMGASFNDAMDGKHGRCPGTVVDMDRDDASTMTLHVTTKWEPHLKAVRDFVAAYAPGADIRYYACEEMDGIYWTNVPGLVFVSADEEPSGETEFLDDILCFTTVENIIDVLSGNLGMTGTLEDLSLELAKRHSIILSVEDTELIPLDDVCD